MASAGEGSWKSLSTEKKIALVLGFPVAAAVGYILYRHFRSQNDRREIIQESRMTVPLEVYRSLARHQGSCVDLVSQQSGAQVTVQADQNTVCLHLQGSTQQVLRARCILEKMVSDCEVITEVFEVPQAALGRIIGRGGENLKLMNRTSGGRVNCSRDRGNSLTEKGKIVITGTRQEVQRAKDLVLEKVVESEEVRRRIAQSSILRQKRRPPQLRGQRAQKAEQNPELREEREEPQNQLVIQATEPTGFPNAQQSKEEADEVSPQESISKFESNPDLSFQPDEHLEVYVSAFANPQHFWIQVLGVRSLHLDKLTAEMGRFYDNGTSTEQKVEKVVVGDIVAAPYRDHGTWNRARVLSVLQSGLVDLYYVDYGDNDELPPESLRRMRSDFLSLPFQAIECSLAGVCPAGESWTEAALDDFDRLTYCAQWKPLLAKLCSYSHSGLSSWPSVQLFDNSHGKCLDLGEELIRLGHAVRCQDLGDEGGLGGNCDPGSLQKMLDDVTGVTSELSLSCISLSGFVDPCASFVRKQPASCFSFNFVTHLEALRSDVDPTSSLVTKSSVTAPSQVDVKRSWSQTQWSPIVVLDQSVSDQQTKDSNAYTVRLSDLEPLNVLSDSSSSCVELLSSLLNSIALSDDVFYSGTSSTSDGREAITISSETQDSMSSSVLSEGSDSSSSSGGIRSVWYYLPPTDDSSCSSASTALPASSTSFEESHSETLSSFVNSPSVDPDSVESGDDSKQEVRHLDTMQVKYSEGQLTEQKVLPVNGGDLLCSSTAQRPQGLSSLVMAVKSESELSFGQSSEVTDTEQLEPQEALEQTESDRFPQSLLDNKKTPVISFERPKRSPVVLDATEMNGNADVHTHETQARSDLKPKTVHLFCTTALLKLVLLLLLLLLLLLSGNATFGLSGLTSFTSALFQKGAKP
ncbi:tudor and KH domain-containing protein-like [Arapaima gigas]